MKRVLMALCLVCLLVSDISPVNGQTVGPPPPSEPKMMVLFYHAEWNGASKGMQTVYDNLINRFDDQAILFVSLDVTNRTWRQQSSMLFAALKIENHVGDLAAKAGTIQFVRGRGVREVLGEVPGSIDFEGASEAIRAAVARIE